MGNLLPKGRQSILNIEGLGCFPSLSTKKGKKEFGGKLGSSYFGNTVILMNHVGWLRQEE